MTAEFSTGERLLEQALSEAEQKAASLLNRAHSQYPVQKWLNAGPVTAQLQDEGTLYIGAPYKNEHARVQIMYPNRENQTTETAIFTSPQIGRNPIRRWVNSHILRPDYPIPIENVDFIPKYEYLQVVGKRHDGTVLTSYFSRSGYTKPNVTQWYFDTSDQPVARLNPDGNTVRILLQRSINEPEHDQEGFRVWCTYDVQHRSRELGRDLIHLEDNPEMAEMAQRLIDALPEDAGTMQDIFDNIKAGQFAIPAIIDVLDSLQNSTQA